MSEKASFSCLPIETVFPDCPDCSSVTLSLVKKYSIRVSGKAITAMRLITRIHLLLSTPRAGRTTIGNMRATMIPDIITEAMLLNTESPPRFVVSRVESGTIRLWLIL